MRTVEVNKRSKSVSQLLVRAQQENLILRSSTGREFILAEITTFDREIQLQRQNPQLMAFLDRRGKHPATKSSTQIRRRLRLPS